MERPPVPQEDPASVPADLVERIYASALEPGRYDELMQLWHDHVEAALSSLPPSDDAVPELPNLHSQQLERHFLRAFAILEKLGRTEDDTSSIEALVEVNTQPSMLVAADGRLTAVNSAATEIFGVAAGDSFARLTLETDGMANIRAALAAMSGQPPSRLLAIARAYVPGSDANYVLALSRAQRPEGAPPVGVLTVADLTWSMRIGELLKQAFGLTDAECDIAKALVSGENPKQIAQTRNRALDTVRTQIKSVLRKVDVRSQGELIRLTAALVQFDLTGERTGANDLTLPAPETLTRPGGRRLDFIVLGPPDGRPAAFIHGMLDGCGVTARCEAALRERGIRLVAPSRPHFGHSDPDGGAKGAPDRFTRDLEAILDTLGIAQCPVIGHMAGSVYAFAAAQHLGSRITGIVNVSGGVPILSRQQFAIMTPRQRIVAYTARYTPTLLPLILRAGIALLDSGGDHAFMKALYETAPVDWRVARRPDVFAILSRGYRFTTRQGHGAFEIDSRQVTMNWSPYVEATTQPVTLVHGRHDPVVRIATVRAFAARYADRVRLTEVEDEGQLLFYARPDIVLDALQQLDRPA